MSEQNEPHVSGEELRAALAQATGLPASVRVVGRPPKPRLDLYA
jgi:hypothetical protein